MEYKVYNSPLNKRLPLYMHPYTDDDLGQAPRALVSPSLLHHTLLGSSSNVPSASFQSF